MLLEPCLCVIIFKIYFLKTQSHFTLMAPNEHFLCHTPSFTHATPQLHTDGVGQCLLPQTSSVATWFSTLGVLPNGLGTLHSGSACGSIFLVRAYQNPYVKSSYTHKRNEGCSYWEWPSLTDEKSIFSSTWFCALWWSNCSPFCHPYSHSPYDG
jgi:hypothetical protein